ncbi:histidinol-phosphate transaminase [Ottowia thiooxydans]|uniref:histidinol-phosphate transaminase n=1 Tax=Ottowia thiooxydans TaxID=219182 RepID=UPI00048C4EB3|nr:histidinol-phosphate transaminase [Ottowia thiooxydans]
MNTETHSHDPLSRLRQDVQGMHAYAVQDSSGMLKLDAMENSHRLPSALRAELGRRLGEVAINRYPGERVHDLKQALAHYAALPPDWSLMLGNGSDELISLLAMACDTPGSAEPAVILAPLPGFVMYGMSAQFQGLAFRGIPLTAEFELDESAMLNAIDEYRPAVLYLAYPNNPTGTLWNQGVIERLIDAQGAQGGLVVMDEAYQPFAARSWIESVHAAPERHRHVLVMRTLSKFGLAGVRLGYLMGPARIVAQLDKLRPPYNVSVLNAECALFALEHREVFAAQAVDIRAEREKLLSALNLLPGVHAYSSEANMLLVRLPDAPKTFEGMKARKVLVKNVSTMHPLLANCLRLTVGTERENEQMLAALQASL